MKVDSSYDGPRRPEEYSLIYIHNRKNKQRVLAKGRKDIGESITQAATREAFEETGYKCSIIPLATPTLAPNPSLDTVNTEAIGVTLKIDYMSRKEEEVPVEKFVYWFVAEVEVDSNGIPVVREEGTQLEYEQYDVREMSLDESLIVEEGSGLSHEADRAMVSMAKRLLVKRYEGFLNVGQSEG